METVVLASGALSAIMTASGGDMRKAVTFLQSSHQLSAGTAVTTDIVTDISGQVNKVYIELNKLRPQLNSRLMIALISTDGQLPDWKQLFVYELKN